MRIAVALLLALAACGGSPAEPVRDTVADDTQYRRCQSLATLHRPLAPPQAGDWLLQHDEPGQTFAEYLASDPIGPDAVRRRIVVVPIGEFDPPRRAVLDAVSTGVRIWFGLEVTAADGVPSAAVPDHARRRLANGDLQLLTRYLLHEVLRPRLPADAACAIAFCTDDLWPGPGWNFVFGESSSRHRVGVWSLHRDGDPSAGEAARRQCVRRALKTAVHEIGHLFGLQHCTAWECCMNGSNDRAESDRHPLWLCPECLPKVLRATGVEPVARYRGLAAFCRAQGLDDEAGWYECAAAALSR